jgi:DNA-directed RNA polymerase subunit RPC12/RpoP
MIQQKIRIKCPKCNSILDVYNSKNENVKQIVCPNCNASLIIKFREDNDYSNAQSKIPNLNNKLNINKHTDERKTETLLIDKKNNEIGKLRYKSKYYKLQEGENIIGRKSQSSTANIQIETNDRFMSRLHAMIEIKCLANGNYYTTITNWKNQNPTYVNGQKIQQNDKFVLQMVVLLKWAIQV